uniref:Protein kinase domain-containing protein n=1 Tax=Oryza glumipatula TaxID=40148 RepID=A0A0D9YLR6_9ORYZ
MPPMLHAILLLAVAATATSASAATAPAAARNSTSNCTVPLPDAGIVFAAFKNVTNFPLPRRPSCRPVRRLAYPSRNLAGVVGWAALGNLSGLLTVDLSGNSLEGDDGFGGGALWRAPLLRSVDVSRNRLGGALRLGASARMASLNASRNGFTSVVGVDGLAAGLVVLDVSGNRIAAVPEGLRRLTRVRRLDMSRNSMAGRFPDDLPPLDGVEFLDISDNNFSGVVNSTWVTKFGRSAFLRAGNASSLVIEDNPPASAPAPAPATMTPPSGRKKHKRVVLIVVVVVCGVVAVSAAVAFMAGCVACGFNRRKKGGKKAAAAAWEDDEVAVGAVKVAATAPVVLVERPLMELTLADLAAATSGFGRESQLADVGGRSGAAYRAVLPGDLHVVVRVVDGAVAGVGGDDDGDVAAAAAGLRELARLRHPNILPLLGYCIAGKEKLLLYEYIEKGNLYRWLHELPASSMDMEETGADMWDTTEQNKKSIDDWPTRYHIILGIARGLAFLHQGWAGSSGRPIVHGNLVPTNVLLGDDLEPRISDYIHPMDSNNGEVAPESDVYSFGVLVFELVTGQVRWDDSTVSWARGVIRNRKSLNIVDARLREEEEGGIGGAAKTTMTVAEREMVECLQVGFLCTAHSPEKRPSMQQVVGVLKDIRPAPPPAGGAGETP